MIRNTWKNIKMVHKKKKNEIFSFQDSYSFAADFSLHEKISKCCQHFGNYVPFSSPKAFCLFCLDL